MATHLVIDDSLIEEACMMGHHTTKKAAVVEALQEYIQIRLRSSNLIFNLFNELAYKAHLGYRNKIKRLASQVRNSYPEKKATGNS